MLPDQLDVPTVGLEEKINQVAEERNRADGKIEAGIGRHAEKGATRNIHPRRDGDQIDSDQRRHRITETRKQSDNPVEPEPHLRTGYRNAIVKQPGNAVQTFHVPVAWLHNDNSSRFAHGARPVSERGL